MKTIFGGKTHALYWFRFKKITSNDFGYENIKTIHKEIFVVASADTFSNRFRNIVYIYFERTTQNYSHLINKLVNNSTEFCYVASLDGFTTKIWSCHECVSFIFPQTYLYPPSYFK